MTIATRPAAPAPPPAPQAPQAPPSTDRRMPALMSACVVVVVAMVAAINLALPELAGSGLRPSATGLLWIVDELGADVHAEAVTAFTDAMALGLRVVAVVVALAAVVVARGMGRRA